MAKIEVTDEFAQLWKEQGLLDAQVRELGITLPVGLREEAPPDRNAAALIAFTSLRDFTVSLVEKHNDRESTKALAQKALADAEKEQLAHKDEVRDIVGFYRPIEGAMVFLAPVPPESVGRVKSAIKDLRRSGSIFRVLRVEEANGHIRVQYVPEEGAGSSDLELITLINGVRNRQAIEERAVVEQRLKQTAGLEEHLRAKAEDERWSQYAE